MFNKDIEKDCKYCKFGYVLTNEEHVICKKYGFLFRKYECRKFSYDPLKRVPHKKPNLEQFKDLDLSI